MVSSTTSTVNTQYGGVLGLALPKVTSYKSVDEPVYNEVDAEESWMYQNYIQNKLNPTACFNYYFNTTDYSDADASGGNQSYVVFGISQDDCQADTSSQISTQTSSDSHWSLGWTEFTFGDYISQTDSSTNNAHIASAFQYAEVPSDMWDAV